MWVKKRYSDRKRTKNITGASWNSILRTPVIIERYNYTSHDEWFIIVLLTVPECFLVGDTMKASSSMAVAAAAADCISSQSVCVAVPIRGRRCDDDQKTCRRSRGNKGGKKQKIRRGWLYRSCSGASIVYETSRHLPTRRVEGCRAIGRVVVWTRRRFRRVR